MPSDGAGRNLILPGNLRYQPKELTAFFGYDNLFRSIADVELATLRVLADIGIISPDDYLILDQAVRQEIYALRTSQVDEIERTVTHHDIRAWVKLVQKIVGPKLARYVHIPLTSADALDTGRSLQYRDAYQFAIKPAITRVVQLFCELIERFAETLQIGRTHGQHALPITVGFWFATILDRIILNAQELDDKARCLQGKISGAVGAYNAQIGFGLTTGEGRTFEERVLTELGLQPARISRQILHPEVLGYFLNAAVFLSGALGQFGRDCRQLMRSEIGEVAESFDAEQAGSSTMAHKRNPITFENLEGQALKNYAEYVKVLLTLISEHQRDLVGSAVARDFPIILVNLMTQLNALRCQDADGVPFLRRITIDELACQKNFAQNADVLMAEPVYIALQLAGYTGDAHRFVNHILVPQAKAKAQSLMVVLSELAGRDAAIATALGNMPPEVRQTLHHPEIYVGLATAKAREVVAYARTWFEKMA